MINPSAKVGKIGEHRLQGLFFCREIAGNECVLYFCCSSWLLEMAQIVFPCLSFIMFFISLFWDGRQ
jgi:hypothetical protein